MNGRLAEAVRGGAHFSLALCIERYMEDEESVSRKNT